MLVPFVGGEADGHFGDDAGEHGAEAFVEGEWGFTFYDLDAGLDEATAGTLWYYYQFMVRKGKRKGRKLR